MSTITKKDSSEPTNQQQNYNTEAPTGEENSEIFFWEIALRDRELEQDERDTVKSLIAEMRYS